VAPPPPVDHDQQQTTLNEAEHLLGELPLELR
jgi:hypothetical protein